jgi:hypothetical protein
MTAAREAPPQSPRAVALMQMLAGRWVSGAVSTAAKLGLADRLAARPRTSAELASEIGVHAASLYRLLRALASLGLLSEEHGERFALTPLGDALRSDAPDSMLALARIFATEEHGAAWNAFSYAVASGEPAFEHVFGRTLWEYFDDDPQLNATFSDAMTSFTSMTAPEIVRHLSVDGVRTVADIGGAAGTLLGAILRRHPSLRGILFDRPAVIADVERDADAVLRERCTFIAGDFMLRVPEADLMVLAHIVHDWGDADAARILANCRAALPAHGRVVVVDCEIEPGDAPDFAKLLDLEMMAMNAGRERTRAEFAALFARAGLRMTGVIPLHGTAIFEAVHAS